MINYRIKTKIYNRNDQRLNTNTQIYNTNERRSNKNIKMPNNATFDMPYRTTQLRTDLEKLKNKKKKKKKKKKKCR